MPNSITTGVAYLDPLTVGATHDDVTLGASAAKKVGFYGKVPVVQRPFSSAVHNTTALASRADFGVTQLAALHEVQLTLIGLGVWATA